MNKAPEVFLQVGDEQPISGRILLASPNLESLMVELDEPIQINNNVYVHSIPLLKVDGIYRDLLNNEAVIITWAGLMQ